MEGRRRAIEALVERLQRHDARIVGLELGEPMAPGLDDVLVSLGSAKPPPELLDLYREIDGAALMWSLDTDADALAGGFNIQSIAVAMARNSADGEGQPLEGVLWTGEEEADALAVLKRAIIFDSVPGRNDFLVFAVDDPARLYLVTDGTPEPLRTTLDETLDVLISYGGADDLRGHLVHADWRQRVAADARLQKVAAL